VGPRPDQPPLPWLLRRTTRLFNAPLRAALSAAGFSDLSQRAMWAVHALAERAQSATELVDVLQVTKQAVSPLVEELVVAGYVGRDADPSDRRRTLLRLTPRGADAAAVIDATCAALEEEFVGVVGAGEMTRLRQTLGQLQRRPDGQPPG
jgi:DNA-binding MarR family transcriptional regulator